MLAGPEGVSKGQNQTIGAQISNLKAATGAAGEDTSGVTLASETINIDGADIKVDWSKLSTEDQAVLKKNWAASDSDSAKKAAKIMEDTINKAIDDSGLGVEHITVKSSMDAAGTAATFTFKSGSEGVDSQLKATDAAGLVGTLTNGELAGTTGKGLGTTKYAGEAIAATEKFYMEINGQSLVVTPAVVAANADMKTVATGLQASIKTAIDAYNTGRDEDDKLKDVKVDVSKDGCLVISSESGPVSFSDFGAGEAVKKLGLDSAGTKTAANGGMTLQIGANEGQTMTFAIGDMSATSLGVAGNKVNLSTQDAAKKATTTCP